MKNLMKSLRITIAFCVLFALFYILVLWAFAQFAGPNVGCADIITVDGKVVGGANVGQSFEKDCYFWGRPSHAGVGYDATKSGGSNKAVTNPDYLKVVSARVDTFLVHHPYLTREEVPSELVTASGSGLDPDITPEAAYVQVKRIAIVRGMSEDAVRSIVNQTIEKPLLKVLGPEKVNVLKLNVALDKAQQGGERK